MASSYKYQTGKTAVADKASMPQIPADAVLFAWFAGTLTKVSVVQVYCSLYCICCMLCPTSQTVVFTALIHLY